MVRAWDEVVDGAWVESWVFEGVTVVTSCWD